MPAPRARVGSLMQACPGCGEVVDPLDDHDCQGPPLTRPPLRDAAVLLEAPYRPAPDVWGERIAREAAHVDAATAPGAASKRTARLEAVVRGLVASPPLFWDGENVRTCATCWGEALSAHETLVIHREGCPYEAAHTLLAELDARGGEGR